MSVFDTRSREYHEMEPIFTVPFLQAEEDARCTYCKAAFINMSEDLNREEDVHIWSRILSSTTLMRRGTPLNTLI